MPELSRFAPKAPKHISGAEFDGLHYGRNGKWIGWQEDGVPRVRQQRPGGQQEPVPRAHQAEALRQQCELRLIKERTLREQLHGQEEEAVRKHKAPQPRHGVSVPAIAKLFKREKPQTEERGLRYSLLASPSMRTDHGCK